MPQERMKAKVCMVGEAAVGKSSLVRRYVHNTFEDKYTATLGARVMAKDIVVPEDAGDTAVKMMVWDIMGETTLLAAVEEGYFYNAQGIVAVCDLTRFSTFERLPDWIQRVQRIAGDVPIALAVNKTDLKDEALVLYDEYRVGQYAEEIGARWCQTSAKTGENVDVMFQELAKDIVAVARRQASEFLRP